MSHSLYGSPPLYGLSQQRFPVRQHYPTQYNTEQSHPIPIDGGYAAPREYDMNHLGHQSSGLRDTTNHGERIGSQHQGGYATSTEYGMNPLGHQSSGPRNTTGHGGRMASRDPGGYPPENAARCVLSDLSASFCGVGADAHVKDARYPRAAVSKSITGSVVPPFEKLLTCTRALKIRVTRGWATLCPLFSGTISAA